MTDQEETEYLRDMVKTQRIALEIAWAWISDNGFSEGSDRVLRVLEEVGVGDQKYAVISGAKLSDEET